MRTNYHCVTIEKDELLISLLESEKIKYGSFMDKGIVFDVYSDNPRFADIIERVNKSPKAHFVQWVEFSKQEMQAAEWYFMEPKRQIVDSLQTDYTFEFYCPYKKGPNDPFIRYHRSEQIRPFLINNKIPKWKPKFNFCSEAHGFFFYIFCSDEAREKLTQSDVVGVDFQPVLKGDKVTVRENIHQVVFPNILPTEAFDFIGEYHHSTCDLCGRNNYEFKIAMGDNIRIKKDKIPRGIDAFTSEMRVGEGYGDKLMVVSKKIYNLVIEEMKERNVRFTPIG